MNPKLRVDNYYIASFNFCQIVTRAAAEKRRFGPHKCGF